MLKLGILKALSDHYHHTIEKLVPQDSGLVVKETIRLQVEAPQHCCIKDGGRSPMDYHATLWRFQFRE